LQVDREGLDLGRHVGSAQGHRTELQTRGLG
jgi:hypothetical protein